MTIEPDDRRDVQLAAMPEMRVLPVDPERLLTAIDRVGMRIMRKGEPGAADRVRTVVRASLSELTTWGGAELEQAIDVTWRGIVAMAEAERG